MKPLDIKEGMVIYHTCFNWVVESVYKDKYDPDRVWVKVHDEEDSSWHEKFTYSIKEDVSAQWPKKDSELIVCKINYPPNWATKDRIYTALKINKRNYTITGDDGIKRNICVSDEGSWIKYKSSTNKLEPKPKEEPMKIEIGVTLINGKKVEDISVETILCYISEQQDHIKSLERTEVVSPTLTKLVKAHKNNITALTDALDSKKDDV